MKDTEARMEIAIMQEHMTVTDPKTGRREFIDVPKSINSLRDYVYDDLPAQMNKVLEELVNTGIDSIRQSIDQSLAHSNRVLSEINETLEMISAEVDNHGGSIVALRQRLDKQTKAFRLLAEAV